MIQRLEEQQKKTTGPTKNIEVETEVQKRVSKLEETEREDLEKDDRRKVTRRRFVGKIPAEQMQRREEEPQTGLRKIASQFKGGRGKILEKEDPQLGSIPPPKSKERENEIDGSEEPIAKADTNQESGLRNASLGNGV